MVASSLGAVCFTKLEGFPAKSVIIASIFSFGCISITIPEVISASVNVTSTGLSVPTV